MNPFIYPKNKHRRKLHPKSYQSNRRYKPILKQEFLSQCVYCRTPDGLKGADTFGVDHYRPRAKFPDQATLYSNLFYACNACNRRKGDFWPSPLQRRAGRFIPNPCDNVMFEHLRFKAVRVVPNTPSGEWTVKLLILNDEESVSFRRFTIDTIKLITEKKRALLSSMTSIKGMTTSGPSRTEDLLSEIKKIDRDILKLDGHLKKLVGAL